MKDIVTQSNFIDLTDEQVRDRLGFYWESVKRLKEAADADVELTKLKTDYKELHAERYGQDIKEYTKLLKAMRKIASLREIRWEEA